MLGFRSTFEPVQPFTSKLFDEQTFYRQFIKDLLSCGQEVIIESPYISSIRMRQLETVFRMLVAKKVKVCVITRAPYKHVQDYGLQAEKGIRWFESIGVQVIVTTNNHHRKLAILDRQILWEGSLNILSQTHSREIMRRITGEYYAHEMISFLKLEKFL